MSPLKSVVCKNTNCRYAKNDTCHFWHNKYQGIVVEVMANSVKILRGETITTYRLSSKHTKMTPGDYIEYDTIKDIIYERVVTQNAEYLKTYYGNAKDYADNNIDILLKLTKLEQQMKKMEEKIGSFIMSRKRHAELITSMINDLEWQKNDLKRQNTNIKEIYKMHADQNKRQRLTSINSIQPAIQLLQELKHSI